MKKLIFLMSIVSALFLSGAPLYAADSNTNADDFFPRVEVKNATKPSDDTSSVQFHMDSTTTLDTPADNDVYAISGTVDIKNTVSGDVFALGNSIIIEKTVSASVRAAGNTVIINGTVKRNVLIFANTVVIGENASLQGNVRIYANTLTMNGTISGAAEIQVKNFNSTGRYLGTAHVTAANVNADINSQDTDRVTVTHGGNFPEVIVHGLKIVGGILSILVSALLGMLVIVFGYPYAQRTAEELRAHPGRLFGRGVIASIVAVFSLIVLICTLIGIPFAIVGFFLCIFAVWLGKVLMAYAIGFAITQAKTASTSTLRLIGVFLVGFIIITVLTHLPYVGWCISTIIATMGVGALTLSLKRSYGSL